MKIALSDIYKAMIEQELPINFNNTIHSLEFAKGIIEFKENDYMKTIISEETEQGWLDSFNNSYNLELKIGDVIDTEMDALVDEFNHMIAEGPAILTTKENDNGKN